MHRAIMMRLDDCLGKLTSQKMVFDQYTMHNADTRRYSVCDKHNNDLHLIKTMIGFHTILWGNYSIFD